MIYATRTGGRQRGVPMPMNRPTTVVLAWFALFAAGAHPAGGQSGPTVTHPFTPADFLLSPEAVTDDGSVRLARSVLLADETGATDFHQTEPLSERVRAKKVFALDSADVTGAELF